MGGGAGGEAAPPAPLAPMPGGSRAGAGDMATPSLRSTPVVTSGGGGAWDDFPDPFTPPLPLMDSSVLAVSSTCPCALDSHGTRCCCFVMQPPSMLCVPGL